MSEVAILVRVSQSRGRHNFDWPDEFFLPEGNWYKYVAIHYDQVALEADQRMEQHELATLFTWGLTKQVYRVGSDQDEIENNHPENEKADIIAPEYCSIHIDWKPNHKNTVITSATR